MAAALMLLSGCATPPAISDNEISSLLAEYERASKRSEQTRLNQRQSGIGRIELTPEDGPLDQRRLSLDLDYAYLDVVLDRLGIAYSTDHQANLKRRISIQLENEPFSQAIIALLDPLGLTATLLEQSIVISVKPEIPLQLDSANDFVFHLKRMRNADTRTLEPLLPLLLENDSSSSDDDDDYDTSYDSSDDSDSSDSTSSSSGPSLSYAAIHSENAIFVKGPSALVRNALQILDSLDSDSDHIIIEALVLRFDADYLLELGSSITNGADGEFSDINIDWASVVGQTIGFTNVAGAANTRMFTAALNILIREDRARVIARPYIATMSGKPASIEVAEDRYVTAVTPGGDDVTLEQVTSGIKLDMLPFELPDEEIRIDLSVSSSQFIPSLGNVSLSRSRSDATSVVQIGSGESLVIGGLIAEQFSEAEAGIPGLRDVPAAGLLFGSEQTTSNRERLLIYITPYLWEPGMEAPNRLSVIEDEFLE